MSLALASKQYLFFFFFCRFCYARLMCSAERDSQATCKQVEANVRCDVICGFQFDVMLRSRSRRFSLSVCSASNIFARIVQDFVVELAFITLCADWDLSYINKLLSCNRNLPFSFPIFSFNATLFFLFTLARFCLCRAVKCDFVFHFTPSTSHLLLHLLPFVGVRSMVNHFYNLTYF